MEVDPSPELVQAAAKTGFRWMGLMLGHWPARQTYLEQLARDLAAEQLAQHGENEDGGDKEMQTLAESVQESLVRAQPVIDGHDLPMVGGVLAVRASAVCARHFSPFSSSGLAAAIAWLNCNTMVLLNNPCQRQCQSVAFCISMASSCALRASSSTAS